MASTPMGNVVSLDAHARARARLSPQQSAGVLSDCRDLALARILQSLGGVLDRVEDELFALAEKSRDRESQDVYLDARAQARKRRPAMEEVFRRQFLDLFNRKVKGEATASPAAEPPRELALVDDAELEQVLAVQAMATRLRAACEGELGALSQRFGFLLEKPDLADEANPVSPETVCGALKGACDQIEAGWRVRLTLLRVLEGQVATELRRVYHDLNARLVEHQILPDVRPTYRRNPNAASPSPAAAPPAPAEGADLYSALAQLLGAVAGAAPAAPGAEAPAGPSPAARGFVQEIHRLQQPPQTGPAPALANVIRDLKGQTQSAALAGVDALTIDIVAMLFDFVFEDPQIPAVVKALLGRLQIPTLKVALLDRQFFSSRAHPARQLLDRLAQAAIGLDEASARGSATLAKLESVVARVLQEFDEDLALFATLSAEMESFLAEQEAAEEAMVRRTARLVEERERREIARVLAEDEIDRRLAERDAVPEPVRVMLEDPWVRALASAHAEHGEDSAPWKAMLATADELLWSVAPKAKPEDRRRLVSGLPALIRALQEGLARAGVAEAERDAFFGALVDCHAEAVKSGLKGHVPAPRSARPETPAAPSIERETVPAGDIQVEEIRLRTPRGQAPVRNVFTRTGIWSNVPRLTWVEFRREGAPALRARLTWISPAKGVYLFTNAAAGAALSVSPEALAEQMRRGEARIVDDASLMDRAVDSMLANLRERAA
jgi:hypothetical protein